MATVHRDEVTRQVSEMLHGVGFGNRRLLEFGGTTEGRELGVALAQGGWDVVVCVATKVGEEQLPTDIPTLHPHPGRLNPEKMQELMRTGFDIVIDATHPYATEVSANVRSSAEAVGLPYVRVIRPSIDYSDCPVAPSTAEACKMVPADGGNVLATTGNKEILAYQAIDGFAERVYARVLPDPDSVQSCIDAGLPADHVIGAQGPFTLEQNLQAIDDYGIEYMISKESGATGGFSEKLEAARERGITMIVVARPQDEDGVLPDELLSILSDISKTFGD